MLAADGVTFEGPALTTLPCVGAAGDLSGLTLGNFLLDVTERFAEHEALVFDDPLRDGATVRWSYLDLRTHALDIARSLLAADMPAGATVGVLMANRPEAIAAIFGVALAGGVVVPLSTFATSAELDVMVRRATPHAVLVQTTVHHKVLPVPAAERVYSLGNDSWAAFVEAGAAIAEDAVLERAAQVTAHDPGLILFSSGTSAEPKGMVHRHLAPVLQFHVQADLFRRTPASRVWAPLPLFWTAGLTTAMGPTLAGGGTFVLQEVFDAAEALRLIERERVTEPYVLPHQGAALAEHPDWPHADLSSLREVYGKSVFTRHSSVHGDPTWMPPAGYGMSETCASVVCHRWDTPRDEMARYTGRLTPGTRLRVIDPDSGEPLPPGATGELALAGPTVLIRYLDRTAEQTLDHEGFIRTGDVGWVEPDGAVHWSGRMTEMIKTAGANVAPAEIETALRACRDVRRARVVGLPDRRLGQTVVLCVELVEGSEATGDDLRAFLKDRIASYKVPREVVVFAADELPVTANGAKVRSDELVAMAASRLGRSAAD